MRFGTDETLIRVGFALERILHHLRLFPKLIPKSMDDSQKKENSSAEQIAATHTLIISIICAVIRRATIPVGAIAFTGGRPRATIQILIVNVQRR